MSHLQIYHQMVIKWSGSLVTKPLNPCHNVGEWTMPKVPFEDPGVIYPPLDPKRRPLGMSYLCGKVSESTSLSMNSNSMRMRIVCANITFWLNVEPSALRKVQPVFCFLEHHALHSSHLSELLSEILDSYKILRPRAWKLGTVDLAFKVHDSNKREDPFPCAPCKVYIISSFTSLYMWSCEGQWRQMHILYYDNTHTAW